MTRRQQIASVVAAVSDGRRRCYTAIDRWREVFGHTRDGHGFVGVDEDEYPYDVETHVRYHEDLPAEIEARWVHLQPLPFDRFDEISAEIADEYAIEWEER